jgi:hypothetical protein
MSPWNNNYKYKSSDVSNDNYESLWICDRISGNGAVAQIELKLSIAEISGSGAVAEMELQLSTAEISGNCDQWKWSCSRSN